MMSFDVNIWPSFNAINPRHITPTRNLQLLSQYCHYVCSLFKFLSGPLELITNHGTHKSSSPRSHPCIQTYVFYFHDTNLQIQLTISHQNSSTWAANTH
jgi:hypothetical protein